MLYEQLNILINETTAMADCLKTVKKELCLTVMIKN